ncbi:hypothetical protein LG290_14930 [Halomonas sediminis]
MNSDKKLENSNLSQAIVQDAKSVNVTIYRSDEDAEWSLEIVDEYGNSEVWDNTFPTDRAALEEARTAIHEEGIEAFIGK